MNVPMRVCSALITAAVATAGERGRPPFDEWATGQDHPRSGSRRTLHEGLVEPGDWSVVATAAAVRYSRDRARASARPIPGWVTSVLTPFFSADVLAIARYTYDWGDSQEFTLQRPTMAYGNASAISLVDTIVFRGRTLQSQSGPFDLEQPGWQSVYLWAHELTHLEQYRELGVEAFARGMMRDYTGLLEKPAQLNAERIANLVER